MEPYGSTNSVMARVRLNMKIMTSTVDFKGEILALSRCILSNSNGGIIVITVKTAAKP